MLCLAVPRVRCLCSVRLSEQQFSLARHVRSCRSKVCTKFAVVPQFVVLPVFQFTSRPWSQEKNSYKICSSPSICRGHDRQQFFGKTESIISGLQKFDNLSRPYEICRHSCRSRGNADTQHLCTVTSGCSFLSAEVVPSSEIPNFI